MGFYGSNDPTDSVKALKEVLVLRIRLHTQGLSNNVRMYSVCYLLQITVCDKSILTCEHVSI